MTFKPANIQEPTPAKRGPRAGNFASDLAALGLHSSQHGFDGGRYGDAEGFASSSLGAGKGKDAIFEIDALKRDLCFTKSAAGSQGDLKTDSHPFGHTFYSQSLPGDFNFIVRKDGFYAGYRPPFNSVIQKGNGVHFTQKSPLAVNPFKNLQILAGLVPSSLAAGSAGKVLTPLQINFTIGWRKALTGNFSFDNKSRQMTPAISVINFCQSGNGVIFNQIMNPVVAVIRSLFVHSNSCGLSRCLCAMQRVIDSVAGALATPFSSRVFKTNKEPWPSFFFVRVRHAYNANIQLI